MAATVDDDADGRDGVGAGDDRERDLAAICSLDDPTRRRLYDYVAGKTEPVTRDQASADLDLDRSVVAYHLDKLVDEGLLAASFARPPGRTGPGAGRPAKRYERTAAEFSVNLPPRDYQLAAELLARAAADDPSLRTALESAAASFGRELADDVADAELLDLLAAQGFEPYDDDGTIRLRNCPFHRLAQRHTELICGMNVAMLGAVAAAIDTSYDAVLDPAPDRCCVAFVSPTRP